MSEVKLHVTSMKKFFAEARQAARRIDAGDHREQGAIIAFENAESLLDLLTGNRWRLLRALRAEGPTSIRHLAHVLKRDYRGVHADVVTLLEFGLIEKTDTGKIMVPWSRITAEMVVEDAAA